MSVPSLRHIELTLAELSTYINSFVNDTTSVVQFGSSVYGSINRVMDVDLMILCKKTTVYVDFESKLIKLKRDLLEGKDNCGFGPEPDAIVEYISKRVLDFCIERSVSVPMFKIGPFPMNIHAAKNTIYFHFKGPISESDFSLYCHHLPIHAKSILYNHVTLKGVLDISRFERVILVTKSEFLAWNLALKKRIDNATSTIAAMKCLRKLLMQYSIYKGHTSMNESDLIINISSQLGINCINFSSLVSVEEVKKMFLQIYEGIAEKEENVSCET